MLEELFKLKQRKTNVSTEILAGITTFISMSYVLSLTPAILSKTGVNPGALFTATALSAITATLLMAFLANQPIAVAPSCIINTFIVAVIVLRMGHSWQFALTAIAIESILFTLLIYFNLREAIINTIPKNLLLAITCGLGFFLIFFGLANLQIIKIPDEILSVHLYRIQPLIFEHFAILPIISIIIGVTIGAALMSKKVKGAIILSAICTALIGIPFGITKIPVDFSCFKAPPSIAPILCSFQVKEIFSSDLVLVVLSLLFLDLFNVVGTLAGITPKAGLLKREDHRDGIRQALLACSLGSFIGSILGASIVSPYIESAAGMMEGGKTGLTALTTATMFGIALFFYPVISLIPATAIVVTIILTGLYLMRSFKYIDFDDYSEYIPSLLTIITIPLLCNIAAGIIIGTVSYVLLKLATGKAKQLDIVLVILAILYCISLAFFKTNMLV
jgi:adenine/guanine/hypoxanthine permease